MQTIVVQVECAKETYELGQGVAKFVAATKTALANGWQTGEDLPEIMKSALSDLVPALDGAQNVVAEYNEGKAASFAAVHHGLVGPLMDALAAKPVSA